MALATRAAGGRIAVIARPCPARAARAARARASAAQGAAADEPSLDGVKALLHTIVSETEFAEVQLAAGDDSHFSLLVRRDVKPAAAAVAAAAAAAAATASVIVPQQLSPPPSPYMSLDDAASPTDSSDDEALCYCTASKVGVFKKAKAKVGDQVRRGQVVGYVEQLGTLVDIKAPSDGELLSFKCEEGGPVEYNQAVAVLAPYFSAETAGRSRAV